RFFVFSLRKRREMRAHGVAGEFEQTVACSCAARRVLFGLELQQIGDEVGLPNPPGLDALLNVLTGLRELARFTGVTIFEHEGVIENEIKIAKLIDRLRRAGKRDETRRLGGIRIEMLMPSVQRR